MLRGKYLFSPGAVGSSRSTSLVTSKSLNRPGKRGGFAAVEVDTSPVSSATPFGVLLAVLITDLRMARHDDAG